MGESELIKEFRSEAELTDFAEYFGRTLAPRPLLIGLCGALGSGKTTWARAMLRGRGYQGRVPSPTYTLLESYDFPELTVAHLDLYRLTGEAELENLALRDWFAARNVWLLVEWPERAPGLRARCDLELLLEEPASGGRRVTLRALTVPGIEALKPFHQRSSSNSP